MYLKTLGGLSLVPEAGTDRKTQRAIASLRPKEITLLCYISLEGKEGILRDRLRKLFYPNKDATNLRLAIGKLKHINAIEVTTTEVRPSKTLSVDIDELEQHLKHSELEQASRLYRTYRDGFLQGVEEKYDKDLRDWVQGQQLHYAKRMCSIKLYLAERSLAEGNSNLATVRAGEAVDIAVNLPFDGGDEFLSKVSHRALALLRESQDETKLVELKRVLSDVGVESFDGQVQAEHYLYGDIKYQDATFCGREKEISQALSGLSDSKSKLLQIVGPPLFGKSALAQKVVSEYFQIYQYAARFSRALFINLEKTRFSSADEVVSFILESLPVDESVKREHATLFQAVQPFTILRRLLRELEKDGGILFVLDGFEKVQNEVGDVSAVAKALLEVVLSSSQSALLLSSRKELTIFAFENRNVLRLSQGLELAAFTRLWEAFEMKDSPFSLNRLWELCFGIPQLAVQFAKLLLQQPGLLAKPQVLERKLTAIAASPARELFERLTEQEQQCLKLIAVCREFATVDLLAKVLKQWQLNLSTTKTKALLTKLADEQLLEIDEQGNLTLHDLYCQEAQQRLSKSEWHDLVRVLLTVHERQKLTPDKKRGLKDLSFDVGLVKLLKPSHPDEAATVLARFMMAGLYRLNYNRLIIQLVTELPERVKDIILKGRCYNWLGLAYDNLGQYDTALKLFGIAKVVLADDERALQQGFIDATLSNLAQTCTVLKDFRQAVRLHISSLRNRIKREVPDDVVVGLIWLGEVFEKMERYRWAKKCYSEATRIYKTVPASILNTVDKHFAVYRFLGLARLSYRDNKVALAQKNFHAALSLARQIGDTVATADALLQRARWLPHLVSRADDLLYARELQRNSGRIAGEKEVLRLLAEIPEHEKNALERLEFLELLTVL